MGGLVEIASVILSQATKRVEINAQNVANIATPGYKRRLSFAEVLAAGASGNSGVAPLSVVSDLSEGKPIQTGNATDLAISGSGFFAVSGGEGVLYTRTGQFHRDADGRLVTANGLALQAQGGGDIVVHSDAFTVATDGTVLEGGEPVAKLAIVEFETVTALAPDEGGLFVAPPGATRDVATPTVRQGFLEASNVSIGDETVATMEAVQRATSAQRLISLYDELMGRALSTFGQS